MSSSESALVFLVPEAEAVVKPFRQKYTQSEAAGVPGHITVLYPFIPPDELGNAELTDIGQCLSQFLPFEYTLTKLRRFPGVLYLAPEPAERFREVTLAIWKQYPDWPPYEGRFADVIPHLGIAELTEEQHIDAVRDDFMQTAGGALPINATATHVTLMDNASGRWRIRTRLPLGSRA